MKTGKGGKNRRRGKNENMVKRELVEKEEGQGMCWRTNWCLEVWLLRVPSIAQISICETNHVVIIFV